MPQNSDLTVIAIPNVPPAMKAKLEELAKKDDRSLASYLRLILENHLLQVEQSEAKQAKKLPVAA